MRRQILSKLQILNREIFMKNYLLLSLLISFVVQLDNAKADDFSVNDFLKGYHNNESLFLGYALGVQSGIFWTNCRFLRSRPSVTG